MKEEPQIISFSFLLLGKSCCYSTIWLVKIGITNFLNLLLVGKLIFKTIINLIEDIKMFTSNFQEIKFIPYNRLVN